MQIHRRFASSPRAVCFGLVVGLASLLLTGCGDGGGVHLDQSDNGKTITVTVGDEVVIALDENPTTGYTWAVEKIDDTILALKSSDYTRTGPPVSGAGGVRTFTFTAKQAGTSPLELKDWRSWEGDKSVIGRYSLTIEVKSS
jgi:inhibitor of cysteine peptidase